MLAPEEIFDQTIEAARAAAAGETLPQFDAYMEADRRYQEMDPRFLRNDEILSAAEKEMTSSPPMYTVSPYPTVFDQRIDALIDAVPME